MAFERSASQFFDQDYHHHLKDSSKNSNNSSSWSCFGSSDSGSVVSELGSTEETESQNSELLEDNDYMADLLSRQMAHNMLQDDDNDGASPPRPLSTFVLPHELQSKQALIDDQIRAIQYYKLNLKQEQSYAYGKHQNHQNKKRAAANIITHLTQNSSNSNPMRANKSVTSGGTGVFLPQGIRLAHASQSRKKQQQGCSTVLIPARVVQALKQHFDKVGVPSTFNNAIFPLQHDGLMGLKNNSSLNSKQQRPAPAANDQEIALPQEWTY